MTPKVTPSNDWKGKSERFLDIWLYNNTGVEDEGDDIPEPLANGCTQLRLPGQNLDEPNPIFFEIPYLILCHRLKVRPQ